MLTSAGWGQPFPIPLQGERILWGCFALEARGVKIELLATTCQRPKSTRLFLLDG
jgi:hypothetical protein